MDTLFNIYTRKTHIPCTFVGLITIGIAFTLRDHHYLFLVFIQRRFRIVKIRYKGSEYNHKMSLPTYRVLTKNMPETKVKHEPTNKRKRIIMEIRQLKQNAEELIENFAQQMVTQTDLILSHAEGYSSSDDDEEDTYSTIHTIINDKAKMSEVVEMLYDLETPRHPYCPGCNRQNGSHPSQLEHMGYH